MRRARLAAALLTLVGAFVGTASPAGAASPACDVGGWFPGSNYATLKTPVDTDTGVAYGEWRCRLSRGMNNDAVRTLQDGMNRCYGYSLGISLAVDGDFGPRTQEALIKVQRFHRISADGVYGPQTADTIDHHGRAWSPYGYHDACLTRRDAGVTPYN